MQETLKVYCLLQYDTNTQKPLFEYFKESLTKFMVELINHYSRYITMQWGTLNQSNQNHTGDFERFN